MNYRFVFILLLVVLAFSLGWRGSEIFEHYSAYTVDKPQLMSLVKGYETFDLVSPSDHIDESNIKLYSDKLILNMEGLKVSRLANTNSMDPVFDSGANVVKVVPRSASEISVGDIVSYSSLEGNIIHRVVGKDLVDDEVYFVLKGDNNPVEDPVRVPFSRINGLLVGILY